MKIGVLPHLVTYSYFLTIEPMGLYSPTFKGPPPPFWGTHKLHKEGKNVARICAKTPRFSTEQLPGPPPPLFRNPVSAPAEAPPTSNAQITGSENAVVALYQPNLTRRQTHENMYCMIISTFTVGYSLVKINHIKLPNCQFGHEIWTMGYTQMKILWSYVLAG